MQRRIALLSVMQIVIWQVAVTISLLLIAGTFTSSFWLAKADFYRTHLTPGASDGSLTMYMQLWM